MKLKIVGHTGQRAILEKLLKSGKLPAAMMFAGPQGIGKSLIAQELARSFFCLDEKHPYGGCNACHHCHLFDVGNLPDVMRVDCTDREKWDLESLRGLLYSLNLRSFSPQGRMILFDNAEHMPIQAANVLLKAVEEPSAKTHFVLITSNTSKLPATLVSRCQRWFFDSLTHDEVRSVIDRVVTSPVTRGLSTEDLVALADGSLENVRDLDQSIDLWKALSEKLPLIADGDSECAMSLAQELSKEKDNFPRIFRLLRLFARARIHNISHTESRRWAMFLTNVIEGERLVMERNLSPHSVLLTMLIGLTPSESFTVLLERDTLLQHFVV